MRVGIGYDVHKLAAGRKLILGGVEIAFKHGLFKQGLMGHSDADVLVHAVMDALLGAAGLGDIGLHFPDTEDQFKDASSIEMLKTVGNLLEERCYRVSNIDSVIVAQRPKLSPFFEEMRENIAGALGINISQVNIKATTEEGLGFTGEGLGMAAHAVTLIKRIDNHENI
ncbi:MAG: 2-C-methyl-D-erythritol 2,4-cyclodiphosphate synthase [Defluviitaleaceae bacterium]|nr:2-C-methyl-D-erythritol 2,4-cyclodiphosphate synthase [Defluviitaleaceae bacterium]MCL2837429.1 2-C-methyl-D-erythritol 2,4-cyclodiphosphate synthase [Defluviitaleaceae bacterium]